MPTTSAGAGVFQLAIAGRRVAWLLNEGGNLESDDYLFTSSVANPRERQVASALRTGDSCGAGGGSHCAGPWLGGLVGSGKLIAMNRWTTDDNGAVTAGQLDALSGTRLKQVATGANTVQATAADGGRVAVLRADGSVALYSAAGKLLLTVDTRRTRKRLRYSGKDLVVVTKTRQLELFNARTGALRKTLNAHGTSRPGTSTSRATSPSTRRERGVLHARQPVDRQGPCRRRAQRRNRLRPDRQGGPRLRG